MLNPTNRPRVKNVTRTATIIPPLFSLLDARQRGMVSSRDLQTCLFLPYRHSLVVISLYFAQWRLETPVCGRILLAVRGRSAGRDVTSAHPRRKSLELFRGLFIVVELKLR